MVNDESKQDIEVLQFETDFERQIKAALNKMGFEDWDDSEGAVGKAQNTDDVYECWDDESFEVIDNSLKGNVPRGAVDILDDIEVSFRHLLEALDMWSPYGLSYENKGYLVMKTPLEVWRTTVVFGNKGASKGIEWFNLADPEERRLYHEVKEVYGSTKPYIKGCGLPAVEKAVNAYKRYLESKGE
jgi:hypothetical protein